MHSLPTKGRPGAGSLRLARRTALRSIVAGSAVATLLFAAPAAMADPTDGLGAKLPTTTVPITALPANADPGLPTSVDLRANAVPVGNQGGVGSCVSWAIGHGLMGFYAKKNGASDTDFAAMYMYSQTNAGRAYSPPADIGSDPREAAELGSAQGIDTRAHYGTGRDFDWATLPTAAEKANAAKYKISGWQSLFSSVSANPGPDAKVTLQNALAGGNPVAITIPVRPGFDELSTTNTLDTDYTGEIRGGHEVLAVGYDSEGLLVQNSWGTDWGTSGYGRMSWDVVNHDTYEAIVATGWGSKRTPVMNTLGAIPSSSGTSAAVLGNVNLYDAAGATVKFQYGTTTAYGSTVNTSITHTPGPGSNAYGTSLTGLTPGTVYHYKVTITSANGTVSNGGDRVFVTAAPPKINKFGAIMETGPIATILGNMSTYGSKSTIKVDYGTTTSYGSVATKDQTAGGVNTSAFGLNIAGLRPGVLYHYKITLTTDYGTTSTADSTFTTLSAPVINKFGAINEGPDVETVLGNVDISTAASGTVRFDWGLTDSYGSTVTNPVSHTPSSGTNAFGTNFRGLTGGTIYHYKVTVTTPNGTVTTGDQQFVTQAPPKVNKTGAITRSKGADILGNISLFTATTGTVKLSYGTTTAYGTNMVQSVAHTGVGSNAFGFNVNGLTAGVTYHFAVTVQTEFGSFTSPDQTFVPTT